MTSTGWGALSTIFKVFGMTRTRIRDLPIYIRVCYYCAKSAGFATLQTNLELGNYKFYMRVNTTHRLQYNYRKNWATILMIESNYKNFCAPFTFFMSDLVLLCNLTRTKTSIRYAKENDKEKRERRKERER
jgi:hypothetical protein